MSKTTRQKPKRSRHTTKVLQQAVTHSTTGQHGVPDQTYLFSLSLIGKWGRFSHAQCEGYEGSPGASSIQPDFSEEGSYSVVGWSLWFKYWVSLILWGFLCLHGVKLSWDNIYEPIHKMLLCFSRQGEKYYIKINALLLQLNLTLDKWNESSNI